MIKHNCKDNLEYYYTKDELLPFGEIVSTVVYRCNVCGKEFLEGELQDENRTCEYNDTNKSE